MQADLTDMDTANEAQDTDEEKLAEVHRRAMQRFDATAWPQRELREQSLQARRFVTIPGAQWEDEWGEQFENSIKVTSDKVNRGLRKIETDYRENRIEPDYRPDGSKADQQTADMLDGLHRADGYRFKSQQARDNAAFEAFAGGFGAYRLTNEWEDESDRDNDFQRINPAALIVDADQSVFFDLNARLYDKSDARFAFIRTAMTREAFEEDFDGFASDFPAGVNWRVFDWFQPDTVAVAEYYEVEEVAETLYILTYKLSGEEKRVWAGELEKGELAILEADGWQKRSQRRTRKRVHKYILSGAEVLEDCGLIAGCCIPIVPVYGRRYFVDGLERWQGYVQDKMDAQRLYNSNLSKLAELNSLSPRETPVFDPEQIDPVISDQWARANIDRLPYLLAHALRDEAGNVVQAGPIAYVKPPDLPPALAALIQIANNDLVEDTQDGAETVKANTSAEAMDIAATRVDAKSGIYLDNVRQSVQREGEIYLSMAADVYADPGRRVDTMTEDGDDGEALLMQRVSDAGETKVINDLSSGRYKVIASVTEATATRRDKTVKSMLATAQIAIEAQDGELAQAAILTAVLNQDGEGIGDFHQWARKRALNLGLVEPNEEELEAMAKAAQEAQQPDPMAKVAEAEAVRLVEEAKKTAAETEETRADTALKVAKRGEVVAKTIETLAEAGRTRREFMTGG